jgi:CBS domain-containing protein
MSLERFCRAQLVTVTPEDPVALAAERMRSGHTGAVVVIDARGAPVGILTDRDLVCRVMAEQRDPVDTRVGEVMSPDLVLAARADRIDQALFAMRSRGVRRLPIVEEDGRLAGILSLDDLLVLLAAELGQTAAVALANEGP